MNKMSHNLIAGTVAMFAFSLSGCNANNVSSMLSTVTQAQTAFNGGGVSYPGGNPSALLAGMDERAKTLFLQKQLSSLGYNLGNPDGIAGPQTRKAVRQYQASNGLATTGQFDVATVNLLMGNMAVSAQQSQTSEAAQVLSQLQQLQQMKNGGAANFNGAGSETQAVLNIFNSLNR